MNPIIKFTTLFGLLAVELTEVLRKNHQEILTYILAAVFLAIAMFFVHRSFYGMRIKSGQAATLAAPTSVEPLNVVGAK
jgi:K(+)-stimulated pyrophosphate-energized sodium pump